MSALVELQSETPKTSRHRHGRLHRLTCIAAALVCFSLLEMQGEKRETISFGTRAVTETSYDVGWPLPHLALTHTQPWNTYTYDWYFRMLVANLAIWLMLVASAMTASELWARGGARFRFHLPTLFLLAFVVGMLSRWIDLFPAGWQVFLNPLRWPAVYAVGCAVYLAGLCGWKWASQAACLVWRKPNGDV